MENEALARFAASLRGSIVQPGDLDYDDARKLHNAMIDRSPKFIARCVDAADVIAAVAILAFAGGRERRDRQRPPAAAGGAFADPSNKNGRLVIPARRAAI